VKKKTASSANGRDGQNVAVVHERLRKAIILGDMAPGEVASQVVLARELGVSRTPLREAVRLLQREGLILVEPNRRIRISDFSIADVEETYLMRIVLESAAIRITLPTLQPEDFGELEGLMAQMEHYFRIDDLARMDVPHRAFHARFVGAAGERVARTIAELFDHTQRYRLTYGAALPGGGDTRNAEHRAILDAANAGDIDLTLERVAEHYAVTAMNVISALDASYDPARLRTTIASVAPKAVAALDRRAAPAPRARRRPNAADAR